MRDNAKRFYNAKPGAEDRQRLATLLGAIEKTDEAGAYDIRNKLIYSAFAMASAIGYEVGIGYDPQEMVDWPVIFIELPTGQVSWHVPAHTIKWDGHTTEEKYIRVHDYSEAVLKRPSKQD